MKTMEINLFNDDGTPSPEALPAGQDQAAACSAEALGKVDAARLRRQTEQEALLFPDGFIADEIVYRLQGLGFDVDYLSIRPRVSELKAAGILLETGTRRLNRRGNTCSVMKHWTHMREAV